MSLERVLKILVSFGFARTEAEVYIYLAKTGPQKGRDLTIGLKMTKQQLYAILKNLKKKGVVTSSSERPALFSALAFEELLNLFMRISAEKVKTVKETKEELVANWRNMTKQNNS